MLTAWKPAGPQEIETQSINAWYKTTPHENTVTLKSSPDLSLHPSPVTISGTHGT